MFVLKNGLEDFTSSVAMKDHSEHKKNHKLILLLCNYSGAQGTFISFLIHRKK